MSAGPAGPDGSGPTGAVSPAEAADRTADALAARFSTLYGGPPRGIHSAPGRVNLIGEHLDYNGGRCLPFAIDRRTLVAARPRSDGLLQIASLQLRGRVAVPLAQVGPGAVPGWACYVAGVAWALRADGLAVPGLDILVDGQVPLGAGLSSSAALEAATALVVAELAGVDTSVDGAGRDALRRQLAAACVRAENEIVGAPTGGMDQLAALFCTPGHALLIDFRAGSTGQVRFNPGAHGLALLVIDTGAPHRLVDSHYADRRAACAAAARALGVRTLAELPGETEWPDAELARALTRSGQLALVRHVRSELARVDEVVGLLLADRVAEIGPLLNASHASLRDDYAVSSPQLDIAVDAAVEAGALGARMTGGGFGGSAIALVPAGEVGGVEAAVRQAFAGSGFGSPQFLTATPSAGAR